MSINHPAVKDSEQTCGACPEAYEGTLTDGRTFTFRYRHGYASLTVGDHGVGRAVGDSLRGVFDSPEERDATFTELLADVPNEQVGTTPAERRRLALPGIVSRMAETAEEAYDCTPHGGPEEALVVDIQERVRKLGKLIRKGERS